MTSANEWFQSTNRQIDADEDVERLVKAFGDQGISNEFQLSEHVTRLIDSLKRNKVQELFAGFKSEFGVHPNFQFWSSYMDMVEILLDFIRANREGNWKLHLDAFAAMLPWMTVYDHTNYARWEPVYLADMRGLPITSPVVQAEFLMGNFVVKRTCRRFNQVPVDQATEWMNHICKLSNGIIGITRNDPARDRFCTTWAERSHITHETKHLMGLRDDDQAISTRRKDALPSRQKSDEAAVQSLLREFHRFNIFRIQMSPLSQMSSNPDKDCDAREPELAERDQLISLTTNDVATGEIEGDLLSVRARGEVLAKVNVKIRLVDKSVKFFDPLKKINSRNFGTLYKTKVTTSHNETKVVKADRKLIQQLLNASRADRDVQLATILGHELSCLPLSLPKTDGQMNSTSKSDLLGILSTEMNVATPPILPPFAGRACVIVDGHALIQSLGKPRDCQTFGDYGNVFYKTVVRHFSSSVQRIDVVFDRYRTTSIKGPTRNKRAKGKKKPIRRIIDRSDIPLPQVWEQFISLEENKADLARFLSEDMMMESKTLHGNQELITAGGFTDERRTQSSLCGNIPDLSANHEEADTRLILHSLNAAKTNVRRIQVLCRDTDVFLMLLHFFASNDIKVWMIGGSSKQQKCYPVHQIVKNLSQPVIENLLGFHAITGSSFTGFGKKASWKVYVNHPNLLQGVGRHTGFEQTQEFVCRLYNVPDPLGGVNKGKEISGNAPTNRRRP